MVRLFRVKISPLSLLPRCNASNSWLLFPFVSTKKWDLQDFPAQARGAHPVHDRTASAGNPWDSGAVVCLPQSSRPRSHNLRPIPRSNPVYQRISRHGPMKEPLPHDVLPWAGCAPRAPANSPPHARGRRCVPWRKDTGSKFSQISVVSPFNSLHNGPELVRKDQEGMNG